MSSLPQQRAVLEALERRAPGVPLLALGQTVFWDEPMKAGLLPLLREGTHKTRPLILGIHDTDYFARAHLKYVPREHQVAEGFALLPHNDGTTRALWSAAGEISRLFGAEIYPMRAHYRQLNADLERVARFHPAGRQAYIDAMTEAWGWRGLVNVNSPPLPICEVRIQQVLPALRALLHWGFEGTLETLADESHRNQARARAEQLWNRIEQLADALPEGNLADLYRYLYRDFLVWLIGEIPETVGFTRTSELLRFNRKTARLPRFRLVDLFLNPQTRSLCESAYNQAIMGTEVYTLPHFGEGALPFDLLVPGKGRGTLLITDRYLTVLTPEPLVVRLERPVHSVDALAEVVETEFGDQCTLVGKALTLITMLAHEYLFVFSERGSPYTARTALFHRLLQASRIELKVYPILRVHYPTWDSLSEVPPFRLNLPEHLAQAFGKVSIDTHEFARRWREVVSAQRALLEQLGTIRSPRALMAFLATYAGEEWKEHLATYETLRAQLRAIGVQADALRAQAHALHAERRRLLQLLQTEPKRAGEIGTRLRELKGQLRALNAERLRVGHTPEVEHLRAQARQIETSAEALRLQLVRNATLTAEGLPYTHARPSAWWFILLSEEWYRACMKGVQLSLENLC